MNVTILGAGAMARGIAVRALAGGHQVQILARDEAKAEALAGELGTTSGEGGMAAIAGAIGDDPAGELVVLAVPYPAVRPLLTLYGDRLAGKVIVDIANPLNSSYDGLATPADTSAAEQVAAAVPAGTAVVKAFNTTFAGTLVAGGAHGQPLDVFLAGDDSGAKALVAQLVEDGKLRAVDVGGLERARQLEGIGLLHICLQFTRGTEFGTAIKLVD